MHTLYETTGKQLVKKLQISLTKFMYTNTHIK